MRSIRTRIHITGTVTEASARARAQAHRVGSAGTHHVVEALQEEGMRGKQLVCRDVNDGLLHLRHVIQWVDLVVVLRRRHLGRCPTRTHAGRCISVHIAQKSKRDEKEKNRQSVCIRDPSPLEPATHHTICAYTNTHACAAPHRQRETQRQAILARFVVPARKKALNCSCAVAM
jgi:hypothetical protein